MGKFIEVRDESGYRTSIQIEKIICIEELEFPRYHNGCNTKITTTEKWEIDCSESYEKVMSLIEEATK